MRIPAIFLVMFVLSLITYIRGLVIDDVPMRYFGLSMCVVLTCTVEILEAIHDISHKKTPN